MTLRDLSLSRHARRFKFYVASAMACVKIFAYSRFSIDTFCYDSLLLFHRFSLGNRVFLEFLEFSYLRSHYGRKLHFYFLFVSSTFSLLCISVNRNFHSRFIVHFSFTAYVVWPSSLEVKKIFNK